MNGNNTASEMLEEVNNAIYSVLVGGQSYKIGTRQMTRADLNLLYKMKNDLMAQVQANKGNHLLDDTYVAIFSGR
ncbi:peptidylprolyl isomerase [Lachnoanaerobaculum sp. Marseille-Q4761]|uniref:peptidylprolyl isomerase n=1 Tax=Lachnoanaerobaculum sp. Marseille-Q4761 TaxID=2819511 RepID=UPI001AA11A55|nr:peptidylprolyl isomerase [Lachnoanaerobaculum sp. Marseille-Q4761]MBO1870086.1 peptidylprolyl isomerase [Lachnoanaerobaculum sp. Marseille-Q4761]